MSRWIRPASCAASSASAIGPSTCRVRADAEPAADDQLLQVAPAHEAHREEQAVVDLAGLVHRARCSGDPARPGSALRGGSARGSRGPTPSTSARNFSATVRFSETLRRRVDDAHPAAPEDAVDPVAGDVVARSEHGSADLFDRLRRGCFFFGRRGCRSRGLRRRRGRGRGAVAPASRRGRARGGDDFGASSASASARGAAAGSTAGAHARRRHGRARRQRRGRRRRRDDRRAVRVRARHAPDPERATRSAPPPPGPARRSACQ